MGALDMMTEPHPVTHRMQKLNHFVFQVGHGRSIERDQHTRIVAQAECETGDREPAPEVVQRVQAATDAYLVAKGGSGAQQYRRIQKLLPNVSGYSPSLMQLMSVSHQLIASQVRDAFNNLCFKNNKDAHLRQTTKYTVVAEAQLRARTIRTMMRHSCHDFTPLEQDKWKAIALTPAPNADVYAQLKIWLRGDVAIAELKRAEQGVTAYNYFEAIHKKRLAAVQTLLQGQCGDALLASDQSAVDSIRNKCRAAEQALFGQGTHPFFDEFAEWRPDLARFRLLDAAMDTVPETSVGSKTMRSFLHQMRDMEMPNDIDMAASGHRRRKSFYDSIAHSSDKSRIAVTTDDSRDLFLNSGTMQMQHFLRDVVEPLSDAIITLYGRGSPSDYRRTLFEKAWAETESIDPALCTRLERYDNATYVAIVEQLHAAEHMHKTQLHAAAYPHVVEACELYKALSQQTDAEAKALSVETKDSIEEAFATWTAARYARLSESHAVQPWLDLQEKVNAIGAPFGRSPLIKRMRDWRSSWEPGTKTCMLKLDGALKRFAAHGDTEAQGALKQALQARLAIFLPTAPHPGAPIPEVMTLEDQIAGHWLLYPDAYLVPAFAHADTDEERERAWYFYNTFGPPAMRALYTSFWQALEAADDKAASDALKKIFRDVMRSMPRGVAFVAGRHDLNGLRAFLQKQMLRPDPHQNGPMGWSLSMRLAEAWHKQDISRVLVILPAIQLILAGDRAAAGAWGAHRLIDWHPDVRRIRALEDICKREDLSALRAEHPGINRLVHFLLAMEGPAGSFNWRTAEQLDAVVVTLDRAQNAVYSCQAEHIAGALPDSELVVEVSMAKPSEALVHGNYGARVGAALASYSEQIAFGLTELVERWPQEIGPVLSKMNAGACIDGQTMAMQEALQELQEDGAVRPDVTDDMAVETYYERCCIAYRTHVIAQYRRAHDIDSDQDPGAFVQRPDFIEGYYNTARFVQYLEDGGFAQAFEAAQKAAGIAYLVDLDILSDGPE